VLRAIRRKMQISQDLSSSNQISFYSELCIQTSNMRSKLFEPSTLRLDANYKSISVWLLLVDISVGFELFCESGYFCFLILLLTAISVNL